MGASRPLGVRLEGEVGAKLLGFLAPGLGFRV